MIRAGIVLAVLVITCLPAGCCKPKQGSTRGQVIGYSLTHLLESGPNPHCESAGE